MPPSPARHLPRLLLLLCLLGIPPAPAAETETADQIHRLKIVPWHLPALAGATEGGFAAELGGTLILAAGPRDEAAPLPVWVLPQGATAWQDSGVRVPRWAAKTDTDGAVIIAGGWLDGRATNQVRRLQWTGGRLVATEIAALPQAVVGAGAGRLGSQLLISGGATQLQPFAVTDRLWSLDLQAPGATWREQASLPAGGRAFGTVIVHNGIFCVFGGLVAGESGTPRATAEAWIYRIKPREGTLTTGWQRIAPLPEPRAGASAAPAGVAQVYVSPGSRIGLLPSAPAPTGGPALLYHTVTDRWAGTDTHSGLHAPLLLPKSDAGVRALGSIDAAAATGLAGREVNFIRSARTLAALDYVVIGAYFAAVVLIGLYFSRRNKSGQGYALGNRNIAWWASGISMFATGASAISFMAIPAQVFGSNLIWLLPLAAQFLAFPVQAWVIFPLLRKLEITSTYEYLERRFNAPLRLIASAQSIVFQTFARMTIVMVLPALALSATTGIPVIACVLIMGLVTTLYTALGGISAVIWTDVLQGTLMLATPLFVIVLAISHVPGGWSGFIATGVQYQKFDFALATWDVTLPAFWLLFLNMFLIWTVQIAGDQPMIQKIFASPTRDVRRTAGVLLICGAIIAVMVQSMGVSIFAYFHHHPAALEPAVANDQIVPFFIVQKLPVGIAGLVIAAIFAAAISTLSGTMISVATLAEQDFVLRFWPDISERAKIRVLRYGAYSVGLIGTGLAVFLSTLDVLSLWDLWNSLAALLGGGVVGVYTLGMFTRRANGFGAICGAVLSIVIAGVVKVFTSFHWAAFLPIAIGTCAVTGYLLSLLRPQDKDLTGLTIFTPRRETGPADQAQN